MRDWKNKLFSHKERATIKFMKYLIAPLCALFVFAFSPVFAAEEEMTFEPVANVIEIKGKATVGNQLSDDTPLDIGAPLFEHDVIKTGPESKIHLLFLDDTELTIGENAEARIDDFTFIPEDDKQKKARLSLLRGAFLFISGQVAKINKPDVTINTPVATIGIRGTIVWGGLLDDQYNVFVKEGAVSVSNGRGNTMVREGQGTTLTDQYTRPSRATEWGEEKINRAVATIALADQETVQQRVEEQRGLLLRDIQELKDDTPPETDDGEKREEEEQERGDAGEPERPTKAKNKIREEQFREQLEKQKEKTLERRQERRAE